MPDEGGKGEGSSTPPHRSSVDEWKSQLQNEAVAKFEIGDEVWVKLRVNGLLIANDYEVVQRRRSSGVYEYRLRDPENKQSYNQGQWVRQEKLSASR
ncbi:MAG: hypothetical protein M1813_008578 [Trichoglossum hirsutum]|nr:MAG: hypothetical protein M1813_008578 [Trichoglossum hirsutum]